MIDLTNLEEIYAHLEAHPATAIYGTCPCGLEINSYTGWIIHAVLPLIAEAIQQGAAKAVAAQEPPEEQITEADIEERCCDFAEGEADE